MRSSVLPFQDQICSSKFFRMDKSFLISCCRGRKPFYTRLEMGRHSSIALVLNNGETLCWLDQANKFEILPPELHYNGVTNIKNLTCFRVNTSLYQLPLANSRKVGQRQGNGLLLLQL